VIGFQLGRIIQLKQQHVFNRTLSPRDHMAVITPCPLPDPLPVKHPQKADVAKD